VNKKPVKLKICTECKKGFPSLWKTRTLNGKKQSFCQTCWAKIDRKLTKEKKEKVKERNRIKKERKRKSLPYLTKQLDTIFSQYIRLRDSDDRGFALCIDGCGQKHFWKSMDCGHFASRRCMSTRWHEQNCAAQTKACNGPIGLGRQYEFGKGLDLRFGEGTADEMIALSKIDKKWFPDELEKLIEYYTEKVHELFKLKSL